MSRPDEPPSTAANGADPPSKTRRKHAMHALQDLGEALLALDAARLAELDLPERLVDAITLARGVRAHEGRRRQLQYVGKLMRDIDPVPIREALERWSSGVPADAAHFAEAEAWRGRLLVEETALDEFVAAHPGVERAALAKLIQDTRAERARGGPPHRYRALFRFIRASVERVDATAEPVKPDPP